MKKVDEYRRLAAECRDRASKAGSTQLLEHYEKMAKTWDRLAEERETFFIPRGKDKPK